MADETRDTLAIAPGNTNRVNVRNTIRIGLFDRQAHPMPEGVAFKIVIDQQTLKGTTDNEGHAVADYVSAIPSKCVVSWNAITTDGDGNPIEDHFEYTREVRLDANDDTSAEGVRARLSNLGYSPDAPLADCVRAFQSLYRIISASDDPAAGDATHEATRSALFDAHTKMEVRLPTPPNYDAPEVVESDTEGYDSPPTDNA